MCTTAISHLRPLASTSSTGHSDARFTILKSTIKGSEGKTVTDEIVQICLSYFPFTAFSSIPNFLHYFQERDVLSIPAGQTFEIRDLSFLFRLQVEDPEPLPRNIWQRSLFTLNKMLALIAKRGFFDREELALVSSMTISPEMYSIQFTSDNVFQVKKDPVTIRPRHLFRMMDAYNVPQLSFDSDQQLQFIGVTTEEQQFERPEAVNLKKWARYAPEGCEISWHLKQGLLSYSRGQLTGWYETVSQRVFIIEAPKGMTLSLIRPLPVVSVISQLDTVSIVQITEEMILQNDFAFHDERAIVIIKGNLTGLNRRVSIIARNVIMCPNARLEVGELDVRTEGSALLLNVTADNVRLVTKGDHVLCNSRITNINVKGRNCTLFGINHPIDIPLRNYYAQIISILNDAIPIDVCSSLPIHLQHSVNLLKAPEPS